MIASSKKVGLLTEKVTTGKFQPKDSYTHLRTIHPANLLDFARGDFRRKHAQWKIKSHDLQFTLQSQQILSKQSVVKKGGSFSVDSLLIKPGGEDELLDSSMPSLSPAVSNI